MSQQINSYTFSVNSFVIQAEYYQQDIDAIFMPLLQKLTSLRKRKDGRLVVFMAAPPGVGKTTLALFLEYLSATTNEIYEIQSVGLDGFHFPQEYIKMHSLMVDGKETLMSDVKGCPETFDIAKVKSKLQALNEKVVKWPIYDRTVHDVVEDSILITKDIVLVEGNWLLLDEPRWRDLQAYHDYSIFISAAEAMLKDRLIKRKMMGGCTLDQAHSFYLQSDSRNVQRVLRSHLVPDFALNLTANGKFKIVGGLL